MHVSFPGRDLIFFFFFCSFRSSHHCFIFISDVVGGAGKTQLRVTAPVSDEQALDNVWEMAHYCQFIDIILINISTLMFH